jgi:hypothetical protein
MHAPEMAKKHCRELLPARESARVAVTSMLPHELLEATTRNRTYDLAEKAAKSFHRRALSFVALLLAKTRLRGDPAISFKKT